MLKLYFLLLVTTATVFGLGGIEDNTSGHRFFGDYKLIYYWPKDNADLTSSCTNPVKYSELDYKQSEPFTCTCTRKNPDLGLVTQTTVNSGYTFTTPLLLDIVNNATELKAALDDHCDCPVTFVHRTIVRQLDANFMVQYEKYPRSTGLYGQVMPSEEELKNMLENLEEVKGVEGQRVCT